MCPWPFGVPIFNAAMVQAVGAILRPKAVRGLDDRRVDRVTQYVDAHLDGDLRVGKLADVAASSSHHFARMFFLATGLSPHAFVAARRMERAAEALRAGRCAAQAAASVGYASGHRFRAAFAAQFALAPSRYARIAQLF